MPLILVLLLAGSCAYGVARLTGQVGATDEGDGAQPGATASPTPVPTVTVTVPVRVPVQVGLSDNGDAASDSGTDQGDAQGGVDGGGQGTVDGGAALDFSMRAVLVDGPLLLGQPRTLRVTVTNPNGAAITLQSVAVRVGTPSAAGCSSAWLEVSSYDGSSSAVQVPARGTGSLDLDAELVNLPTTNQNGCKGASFPLGLTGSAIT